MTQIKKTLSIAGIIALATAPAMAEIASTDYVQNIVNNMIPKTGAVGHVLKKTATGLEWAAAPSTELKTTTGQSATASMTQKAITDALDAKLSNNATAENALAIGNGAQATAPYAIQLGAGTNNEESTFKVAITGWDDGVDGYVQRNYTLLDGYGTIPEERLPYPFNSVLSYDSDSGDYSINESYLNLDGKLADITIDAEALASTENVVYDDKDRVLGDYVLYLGNSNNMIWASMPDLSSLDYITIDSGAIAIGEGAELGEPGTFQVWDYQLLDDSGRIPSARLANGGSAGQVLTMTASGMQWAAAPVAELKTTTGQSTTVGMTQKAITDALATKLTNKAQKTDSLAIGSGATNTASGSIQLGNGTTFQDGVFNVALTHDDETINFTLLDSNGLIPSERLTGNDGQSGQILTSNGDGTMEWTAAPSTELKTTTGQSATASMTQKAITDALATKLTNTATGEYALAIGTALAGNNAVAIGNADPDDGEAYSSAADNSVAIGWGANAYANESIAIGWGARVDENATNAIQLGWGTNETPNSFSVGIGDNDGKNDISYPLLVSGGTIPYERFAPLPPVGCKASVGQKCALVVTWDGNDYSQSWEVVKVNQ